MRNEILNNVSDLAFSFYKKYILQSSRPEQEIDGEYVDDFTQDNQLVPYTPNKFMEKNSPAFIVLAGGAPKLYFNNFKTPLDKIYGNNGLSQHTSVLLGGEDFTFVNHEENDS